MKDKTIIWKDETGNYKIGYSQKLQERIDKELVVGNILKIVLGIIGLVMIALLFAIYRSGVITNALRLTIC